MFKEWDFLLAEIWALLVLAALVGLVAGWIIWGGRNDAVFENGADVDDVRRLQAELDREKARGHVQSADPFDDVPAMQGGGYSRPQPVTPPKSMPVSNASSKRDPKPAGLTAPRDGLPDDLTKIKGVGGGLEKLCNGLGFWHYDQIACWTADEIVWVDDNLKGFKGRVTRDRWVEQAKVLARNQSPDQPPAFVRHKD